MTPFFLISGFLGSGKTTFLKNILAAHSKNARIVVIQNEFAPSGIDGKELKMGGSEFKLLEINNGSVFCVCLMGGFIESLSRVIEEYNPEMIFLESSGLSDPVNIVELLQDERIGSRVALASIYTLVDAVAFDKGMRAMPRFKHQIMIADVVLINKTDLFAGDTSALHTQIRRLNPFAVIQETRYAQTDLSGLLHMPEGDSKEHRGAMAMVGRQSEGRPDMRACVFRTHDRISLDALHAYIQKLQKVSPRIKGYVNMSDGSVSAIQSVFDQMEVKPVESYTGPTELIAFGKDLEPRFLRELFNQEARLYGQRPMKP